MSGATAVVYVNDYIMLVHCYRAMTMCESVTALQRRMAQSDVDCNMCRIAPGRLGLSLPVLPASNPLRVRAMTIAISNAQASARKAPAWSTTPARHPIHGLRSNSSAGWTDGPCPP